MPDFLFVRRSVLVISLLVLVAGLAASAVSPAPAYSQEPVADRADAITDMAADEMLVHLRQQDEILERLARRLADPEGLAVDVDEVGRFVDSLLRLRMEIEPFAVARPELDSKHAVLVTRARELASAVSRARGENADLVARDESIRWLDLADDAFVAAGSRAAELSRRACESAAEIAEGTRAVPGLDGTREALLRFVSASDGRYLVDTGGSRTDTTLLATDGCRGVELARGDDESSLRAQIQLDVEAGKPVWIRVGSDRAGWVRLTIEKVGEGTGTASISGVVTARATGLPIEGLRLRAVSDTRTYIADTAADGTYEFTDIESGTYEVFTRDFDVVWINQIWQDIDCGIGNSACFGVDGDPIPVADDQQVENIDFSLARPSVLSGTVVDSVTGDPVQSAQVRIGRTNSPDSYTYTDHTGRYRFSMLTAGTYFVGVTADYYESILYDDIPCPAGCSLTDGTPVVVDADGIVAGIDFALRHVEGIAGFVTSAADGAPVGNVGFVQVYSDDGLFADNDFINFDGSFFVAVPGPGTYFARTDFYSFYDWVNQLWDGIDCPDFCDLGLATPIVLGANEVAEISFEVLEDGQVAGTVTAADAGGLGGFSTAVRIYDDAGAVVGTANTQQNGSYVVSGIGAGDHYAVASNFAFRSEVYDDIACSVGNACDPLLGTSFAVQYDTTTSAIDFALDRMGAIEGRVARIGGAVGIPDVDILAVPTAGPSQGGSPESTEGAILTATDANGDYRLVGFEAGSYNVYTGSFGYLDKAYDDLPCEDGCDLTLADAVVVPDIDTVVGGIDFELQRKAWIEGTVTDAATGDPVPSYVGLFRADGSAASERFTNQDGEFVFEGLEDGSYFLVTNAPPEYVDELYENIPCEYLFLDASCDVTTGTPISVAVESGAVIDLELDVGGAIAGRVSDVFGNSVNSRTVYALDALGNVVGSDSAFGTFYRIEGLAAGNYYVLTANSDHQDELWPDVPCLGVPIPNCTLADGTAVAVSLGATTPDIDFVLEDLATISGLMVDSESGAPVTDVSIAIYDSDGLFVNGSSFNPFVVTELPPDTYYLRTVFSGDYLDQVYGGDFCDPDCDVTAGTPIVVGIGDVVTDLEIPLVMGPGLRGRVIDGPTGVPLAGIVIDLWDADGEHLDATLSDAEGRYRLPYSAGTYFLSTHNDDGLEDFLFDGIPCPDGSAWEGFCDPTLGTPYEIEEYTPLRRLDFAFGDPTIFSDSFETGDASGWSVTVGGS